MLVLFLFAIYVCVHHAQAAGVDADVSNSDGATAVMLAVRDVDLFGGLVPRLPWEHRPVEVVRELLGVSA